MTSYRISKEATGDLDAIWDYIAERSSAETATSFLERFYEAVSSTASSPRAGINVPDFPVPNVRKFPMGNYLIYYRMLRGNVLISRVLHGKRVQSRAFRNKS